MEGYKYRINEKGVPVPILTEHREYSQTPPSHSMDTDGVTPRAIHHLFDLIKQQTNLQKKRFTVYCSYLQVYKEKIYDLLNKSTVKRLANDGPGLKLKWNKLDHFTVENLYTFECRSPDDVMALYHFGLKNKVVASHSMNNQSSRSHTMLSITVEQVDVKNPDNIITSKLQMVDLAGSER
jgi:kinesin family protein 4/21/27